MLISPEHPRYNDPFELAVRAADENSFSTILLAENAGKRPATYSGENGEIAASVAGTVWQEILRITEAHCKPGQFTTLHAFEWTAAPDGNNLHRNIFFRGIGPDLPISWFEARKVEDLWDWVDMSGSQFSPVLAIPHNSNMSGGMIFRPEYSDGRPMDAAYAQRRAQNEPLFEMI